MSVSPDALFGESPEMMPVGHVVRRSDPAASSSAGWVKTAEVGNSASYWTPLAALP